MTCANPFAAPWKVPAAWVPALVFGLGIVLLLPSIWSETSVTGMDEYWLSFRTPMEMRERGDWLTPWLNGEPRLQKPPLIYWAILLNYKLFGVGLVSARIWGVLSGAGLALCACLFSRELFGRDGLLAGLLALATMGVAIEGRRAMLDLPSAFFSTLAVLCFLKWLRRTDSSSAWNILLSAFLLGLSFLTKGPVGFLFFGAGLLACFVVFRARGILIRQWWQIALALLVLAAICLPWPLAMRHLWSERLAKIMGDELAARQFGHWTPGSPLSAWSGALGLVLPWTPLMIAALVSQFRPKTSPGRPESRFLILWFLLAALPFFFMRSFERYMLALLPAQVVLCSEWLEDSPAGIRKILLRVCVLLLAVVSLAICLFVGWFKLAAVEALLCLCFTGLAIFLAFRPVHPQWLALCAALIFAFALGGVYPRLGINSLPEILPPELSRYPVTMFDPPQPSLLSMRLARSLQPFDSARLSTASNSLSRTEMVFVDGARRPVFFDQLRSHQLAAEEKGHIRTFYSRRAWIRFARPDATWEDWKAAFHARSLDGLKAEFYYYLVSSLATNSLTAQQTGGAK